MSHLFRRGEEQTGRIRYLIPVPRGRDGVDDRQIPVGLIHVSCNGLRCCDAPPEYGSHETLCNRWKRWSGRGVFLRMVEALAGVDSDANDTPLIDARCPRRTGRLRA